MKKFDFHIHLFPESIATKTVDHLSKLSGLTPFYEATTCGLLKHMSECKIDKSLLLPIATNEKQEKNVNDFAISLNGEGDKIVSFGSVYPFSENPIATLEYLVANNIKGIKLHPEYQEFEVDEKGLYPIYEFCQKNNLVVVFHCGKDLAFPNRCNCTPEKLKKVVKAFPYMRVVGAHLGGWKLWEEVLEHLCGLENLYLDTAFIASHISQTMFLKICEQHGIDKILFATDFPWSNGDKESSLIDSIGFSHEDLEKIYYKNAIELIGL